MNHTDMLRVLDEASKFIGDMGQPMLQQRLVNVKRHLEGMKEAFDAAFNYIADLDLEPGDSRAVSDIFVALAYVQCFEEVSDSKIRTVLKEYNAGVRKGTRSLRVPI